MDRAPAKEPLEALTLERSRVAGALREGLFSLLEEHFQGATRRDFDLDLEEKEKIIVLQNASGELAGFSTFRYDDMDLEGEQSRVAFFGDTIMRREAWGSPAFPRAVIRELMAEAGRIAPRTLYTLLICSGYRTYRFLPFFCKDFVPRPGRDTAGLLRKRDLIAGQRFGPQFDPATGVIRLERGGYGLKGGLADVEASRLGDPWVDFFIKANPGWRKGDELAGLAPMTEDNLTPASRRLLR